MDLQPDYIQLITGWLGEEDIQAFSCTYKYLRTTIKSIYPIFGITRNMYDAARNNSIHSIKLYSTRKTALETFDLAIDKKYAESLYTLLGGIGVDDKIICKMYMLGMYDIADKYELDEDKYVFKLVKYAFRCNNMGLLEHLSAIYSYNYTEIFICCYLAFTECSDNFSPIIDDEYLYYAYLNNDQSYADKLFQIAMDKSPEYYLDWKCAKIRALCKKGDMSVLKILPYDLHPKDNRYDIINMVISDNAELFGYYYSKNNLSAISDHIIDNALKYDCLNIIKHTTVLEDCLSDPDNELTVIFISLSMCKLMMKKCDDYRIAQFILLQYRYDAILLMRMRNYIDLNEKIACIKRTSSHELYKDLSVMII